MCRGWADIWCLSGRGVGFRSIGSSSKVTGGNAPRGPRASRSSPIAPCCSEKWTKVIAKWGCMEQAGVGGLK